MLPFILPFIRWAHVARLVDPGTGTRRIYDHELVLCVGGQGTIVIEGQRYEAKVDRLFFIQPRQWHAYRPHSEVLSLLGVHFDWAPQADTLRFPIFRSTAEPSPDETLFREPQNVPGWDVSTHPFLDLGGNSRIPRMLEAVVAEYGRADEFSRDAAGALLAAAILQLSREARSLEMQRAGAAVGADALRRIARARIALEDTDALPSIEEAAAAVGWSGDHLRRMFRRALGASPQSIQMTARLRLARDLLRAGNLPVAEVARRCGFEDASHFSRAFKAEDGLTPREFQALAGTA